MNTVKKISLMALALSLTIIACKKKDDAAPAQTTTTPGTAKKTYEKRWNVTSAQRLSSTTTAATIIAVEFNLGSYIIFYSNDSVGTGSFTEINGQTLQLGSYGTLSISSLTDNTFNFTITPTGKPVITVTSTPAAVASTSTNTTLLCNTWKLTSQKLTPADTSNVAPTDLYVTFSQYGTYLVKNTENGATSYSVNSWKWSDANENTFCYGAWDGKNITTCDTLKASVVFSNNNAQLTVNATYKITSTLTETETDILQVQ